MGGALFEPVPPGCMCIVRVCYLLFGVRLSACTCTCLCWLTVLLTGRQWRSRVRKARTRARRARRLMRPASKSGCSLSYLPSTRVRVAGRRRSHRARDSAGCSGLRGWRASRDGGGCDGACSCATEFGGALARLCVFGRARPSPFTRRCEWLRVCEKLLPDGMRA